MWLDDRGAGTGGEPETDGGPRPAAGRSSVTEPAPADAAEAEQDVGFGELAGVSWVKGNFTYGGGSATIATLRHNPVERREWLKEEPIQLSHALSRLTTLIRPRWHARSRVS